MLTIKPLLPHHSSIATHSSPLYRTRVLLRPHVTSNGEHDPLGPTWLAKAEPESRDLKPQGGDLDTGHGRNTYWQRTNVSWRKANGAPPRHLPNPAAHFPFQLRLAPETPRGLPVCCSPPFRFSSFWFWIDATPRECNREAPNAPHGPVRFPFAIMGNPPNWTEPAVALSSPRITSVPCGRRGQRSPPLVLPPGVGPHIRMHALCMDPWMPHLFRDASRVILYSCGSSHGSHDRSPCY